MNMHTAFDSLINLVSGLGGLRDKSTGSAYAVNVLDRTQLEMAYRGDWIARKVVDIPAHDATRAWRAWQAEDDQIELLEEFERAFQVQAKVRRAMILARLYGGAAIILGVDGAGLPDQELDLERVKKDSLKFLHVVHRHDLRSDQVEEDIMSPYYAEPKFYERNGISTGEVVKIHPSRVVRLIGAELPDSRLSLNGSWGDSVLQAVDDAVKAAGSVAAGVAFMVQEAKIDVIKIPNLSKNLSTAEYTSKLTARFAYANQAKSLVNTLVLDDKEEWERITQNFGTLPEVLQMYLLIASGAADIPATRMLGQSPTGMNSTGESDIRNYYDRVASDQVTTLQPALSTRLDEVILRSVLGSRPEEIHYRWNPLWQLDDVQKADLALKKAQAFKVDVDLGMISPEALRAVRENQLIEDGTYPGLEQALEDFPDEDMEEEPDEMALIAAEQERVKLERMKAGEPPIPGDRPKLKVVGKKDASARRRTTKDAKPRTLYVRRDVVNTQDIVSWALNQGLPEPTELHVTIAFSRQPVDWMKAGDELFMGGDGTLKIPPGGARMLDLFGPEHSTLVLLFNSSALSWRHENIRRDTGASWDWPDYQPHITINLESDDSELTRTEPYRGEIVLGPEIFEEVKEDA